MGGVFGTQFYRAPINLGFDARAHVLFVEILAGQRAHWVCNGSSFDVTSTAASLRWVLASWADSYAPRTSGYGIEVLNAAGAVVWGDHMPIVSLSGLLQPSIEIPAATPAWVATEARLLGRRDVGSTPTAAGWRPGAVRSSGGALSPQGLGHPFQLAPNGWVSPDARIRGLIANIDFNEI